MNDALTVLYVVGCAMYLGWEAHKRFGLEGPCVLYAPPLPPPPHEPRAAQNLCRCERCAPPFHQESPPEEQ